MRERLPFDDDYELINTNFDEVIRRGLEELAWEKKQRLEE